MAIEIILGTETEVRGIQGIEMRGEQSPMKGIPMAGHQSVMTIALEMTEDELLLPKLHIYSIVFEEKPVDLY